MPRSRRKLSVDMLCILVAVAAMVAALVALPQGSCAPEEFHRHSVLRLQPIPGAHQDALLRFLEAHPDLDVWRKPSSAAPLLDVRVGPLELAAVHRSISKLELESSVIIPDVQEIISEQERHMSDAKQADPAFGWENYYRLREIYDWLAGLTKMYPDVSSIIKGGSTYERREILGIKLKFGKEKPIAFLEAGIHAREWISPATATYLINEILTNNTKSFRKIVESYEWHIFPVVNPDGYEYTFTTNRMWRKTRSFATLLCRGVDGNRNWPFHWGEQENKPLPCSEDYPGPRAESEVETQTLRRYLDSLLPRAMLYISLHSYGQQLMFPWGYTSQHVPDHDRLNEIAGMAVAAIRARYGTEYQYGSITDVLYPTPGSTNDYVYSIGIKYSFVLELRDKGQYGFLLPAAQIRPSAQETVDGLAVLAAEAASDITQQE